MINIETIEITSEILNILTRIDEFKGAWRSLGILAPERLRALRNVATIESIGSSTRIEGSKLSNHDVEKLFEKISFQRFETIDEQEAAGYARVMGMVFYSWADIPITENHIKQLHRDLLGYSRKDERPRGHYKTLRNDVSAFDQNGDMVGIFFETATPFDIPSRMKELMGWLEEVSEVGDLHPLIRISIFVVVFLEIHPFQDGNGRLIRILTTLLLLKSGYEYVPYASLESVIENSKDEYYLALRQTQGTIRDGHPNWHPWLLFFLRALEKQIKHLSVKVERERRMLFYLSNLSISIIDYARQHGRVTSKDMVREISASPNTLKSTFGALVGKNILNRHGGGRSTWYSLNI